MFSSDSIHLLNVERIGWLAIFTVICFDIHGEAYAGIDFVISGRGIIIDKELAVVSVLDGVSYDFCGGIVVRYHPAGSVDDGSAEG